jgi:hypothetical protein
MARIVEPENGATHAKLNSITVEERCWRGDPLIVYQSPIEASEIYKNKLPVLFMYLCMAPRDDRRISLYRYVGFRIAPNAHQVFVYREPLQLAGG